MWETIKTPAYVVDEKKLRENLECLHRVEEETGCHILLAQKAFSMFRVYPLIGSYLSGTTASGLYEARLGYEEMKKENHVFAPAYKTEDMKELVTICDHIIFNSLFQGFPGKRLTLTRDFTTDIMVQDQSTQKAGRNSFAVQRIQYGNIESNQGCGKTDFMQIYRNL